MLILAKTILLFSLSLAILGVSGYFCYLLFNWAKLVRETNKTLADINKKLEKVDPILNEASETSCELLKTVKEIDKNFLKPIASVSQIVRKIKEFIAVFKQQEEEEK